MDRPYVTITVFDGDELSYVHRTGDDPAKSDPAVLLAQCIYHVADRLNWTSLEEIAGAIAAVIRSQAK